MPSYFAGASLRDDARYLLDQAVAAVEPERLVGDFLHQNPQVLGTGSIRLIAIGKAAAAMANGARRVLGDRSAGGVILLPAALRAQAPPGFDVFGGGHPIPDEAGKQGAEAIYRLASEATSEDTLLVLISGGGSALMTLPPPGIELPDVQTATEILMRAGATIQELNAFRKHVDQLKGGRLAKLAAPARIVALVLSDVVGDPLDVIASGPVTGDPTSYDSVRHDLDHHGVWQALPSAIRDHLEAGQRGEREESPGPQDLCFHHVTTHLVGTNRMAVDALLEAAKERGYRPLLLTTELVGEAREVGMSLAAKAQEVRSAGLPLAPPCCLVAAGETTVTVTGSGRGGRNQELVLGAIAALDGLERTLLASMGTDGIDGPTPAAGAVADGDTLTRAQAAGLSPQAALDDNDAYTFFAALEDCLITGPTGTNVMDIALLLVG